MGKTLPFFVNKIAFSPFESKESQRKPLQNGRFYTYLHKKEPGGNIRQVLLIIL